MTTKKPHTSLDDPLAPLASYASAMDFDSLPADVVEAAKMCILNNVACGLLGASETDSAALRETATWLTGGGSDGELGATAFLGRHRSLTPFAAVVFNATVINDTELSEGVSKAVVHPGTVIVPAVLAVAESGGYSGRDVIASVVGGYECLIRIGWALAHKPGEPLETVQAQSFHRGWYPPAVLGGYGVIAAAGRLLKLSADELCQAFGIYANVSPTTLMASFRQGAQAKGLGCGVSAGSGLLAIMLARLGFSGVSDVPHSLFPLLVDEMDVQVLTDGLGARYEIRTLDVKFFAAGPVLSEIECAFQLRERFAFSVNDVVAVSVDSNRRTFSLSHERPDNRTAAKFSGPYCIAQVLLGRTREEMMTRAFSEEALAAPDWQVLADKIQFHVDSQFDRDFESVPPRKRPSRIRVTLADGRTVEHEVEGAPGLPMLPPTRQQYLEKFRYLASHALSETATDALIDTICDLESVDDVGALPSHYAHHEWRAENVSHV